MTYPALFLIALLAAPGEGTGALRIRSQPGVEVLWEGVALGETDAEGLLVVEDIPLGDYLLTLRAPGYRQIDVRTTVASGNSILELPLVADEAPAEPSPPPTGGADSSAGQAFGNQALLWLGAGLLVLVAAGWRILSPRRREAAADSPIAEPPLPQPLAAEPAPPDTAPPPAPAADSPTFLEDLKRREQSLEEHPPGTVGAPEETIIEVEAVEVRRGSESS